MYLTLREKCPDTKFFLVCIFLYSEWIQTRKKSVFGHFLLRLTSLGMTTVELKKNPERNYVFLLNHQIIENDKFPNGWGYFEKTKNKII